MLIKKIESEMSRLSINKHVFLVSVSPLFFYTFMLFLFLGFVLFGWVSAMVCFLHVLFPLMYAQAPVRSEFDFIKI